MKWSKLLIPTVKEIPADAEVPSHQLMVRAGLLRKVASGTYTYLPLGWRILQKIMTIIRDEMDSHGGQEILMPILQPMELWQKTGRNIVFEDIMCQFTDRHGRDNVLAPTAEEVVTSLVAGEINSYKQLPMNLYQINTKFRDEFRPRFGVLRSREFIMKDAYSFHADQESLDETYQQMSHAYCSIFDRCGLEYIVVEAESGGMGGSGSQEFMVSCSAGEDIIVQTEDGSYGANIEKAQIDPVAREKVDDKTAAMEQVHTPKVGTIEAVCEFLKTRPGEMIKTLIYSVSSKDAQKHFSKEDAKHDGRKIMTAPAYFLNNYVVLVRGDHEVNEEKLKKVVGEDIELADEATIDTLTGAAVGFAGPMGLAEKVAKLIIDQSVSVMAVGVTGANKTDYHVRNVVPGRDFPIEGDNITVADIRNAVPGDTFNSKKLVFSRGIEVGHVFKLGNKYSKQLDATFLDANGKSQVCLMGCYGIGVNRIMASAIETSYDKDGIIWPISIAPFEVLVTSVNQNDQQVAGAALEIYQQLRKDNIDVLLDDRAVRGGVKFKDADLIGIPIRITVGKRGLAEGKVEIKLRRDDTSESVTLKAAAGRTVELVKKLYGELGNIER